MSSRTDASLIDSQSSRTKLTRSEAAEWRSSFEISCLTFKASCRLLSFLSFKLTWKSHCTSGWLGRCPPPRVLLRPCPCRSTPMQSPLLFHNFTSLSKDDERIASASRILPRLVTPSSCASQLLRFLTLSPSPGLSLRPSASPLIRCWAFLCSTKYSEASYEVCRRGFIHTCGWAKAVMRCCLSIARMTGFRSHMQMWPCSSPQKRRNSARACAFICSEFPSCSPLPMYPSCPVKLKSAPHDSSPFSSACPSSVSESVSNSMCTAVVMTAARALAELPCREVRMLFSNANRHVYARTPAFRVPHRRSFPSASVDKSSGNGSKKRSDVIEALWPEQVPWSRPSSKSHTWITESDEPLAISEVW
mmetsp:Transcript_28270/g.65630  ORF Transcript_28270/g.65630 Transcript_28270/m.65630 type:complete len:362 (+) Transcript_28270:302-1387(+)